MKTNRVTIGILAHVDAGKTTLAESILYLSGAIKETGRVDHKNAFLDTHELEKLRGITIFSKQAEILLEDIPITLLDTPGHVDFGAEMERTLQVLDYAILVIDGMDKVQGHVKTLWSLLKRYQIPVFIFINKMDQENTNQDQLMQELQTKLSEGCLEFPAVKEEAFYESLALCNEQTMEKYLEMDVIEQTDIIRLIRERSVFPCFFGSALRLTGVMEFMQDLKVYIDSSVYPESFGARVFKIARDAQGTRLTYLKVTGGTLKVKMPLSGMGKDSEVWEEKVDQIRIYSGVQYQSAGEAGAGTICAVTGLSQTYAGAGLGMEKTLMAPILEPVLTYSIRLPKECDVYEMYTKLCQLEEEEPQLHLMWDEKSNEIHVQVMGEVQIEILRCLILERYGVETTFSTGNIVYKETIEQAVAGVGHFEPLRHYAEVHLLLEPSARGSGISYASACSEDMLDRNWQRLILTHLQERKHPGVLTGSEITDIKILLVAGRAHKMHTEGGDFRQATYRAVRQGLKKTKSILLEPYYEFTLEIPSDKTGRAMSDIQKMSGTFSAPDIQGDRAVITGQAPVSEMTDYNTEVVSYTRGEGTLFCSFKGYDVCHNEAEIIALNGYDSEKDADHPTGSVFCAHGAGFYVQWDKVEAYMHLENVVQFTDTAETKEEEKLRKIPAKPAVHYDEKELEEIFVRTYGAINKRKIDKTTRAEHKQEEKPFVYKKRESIDEYLLVDGYNIIFAWDELKELARVNISAARDRLCEILCNYQGYKKNTIILVFDAYKVDSGKGEVQTYNNIFLVYTKKAETADQYIEKTVKKIVRKYNITVATSDGLEQMIVWGMGAMRLSANGLRQEIDAVNAEIREEYLKGNHKIGNHVLPDKT